MKLALEKLGTMYQAFELHGEPDAYGGRPVIASVEHDPGMSGAVRLRLASAGESARGRPARVPGNEVAGVLGVLAQDDRWGPVG
jgi:hypothetical protein